MSQQAYQQVTGKAHLPDPYLPQPSHDWVRAPYGWTVNTMCGLVLRRARLAPSGADPCRKCAQTAVRRLPGNCWHSPDNDPAPGNRCKFCRVEITWTGPGERDWDAVESWRRRT